METCDDMICACGEHECIDKGSRDVTRPIVFDSHPPQTETKEQFRCYACKAPSGVIQKNIQTSRKYDGLGDERRAENQKISTSQRSFEVDQDTISTYVAKPDPSKVSPDHICETYQPFVPEPCVRCGSHQETHSCVKCSYIFDEYEEKSKDAKSRAELKKPHERRVTFECCDDEDNSYEKDDVTYKTCLQPREEKKVPAAGESAYGDVPYLASFHDPLCVKRELFRGRPDNLFTNGPFEGRSETADRFTNPGLPPKEPWVMRQRFMEPPPFCARSLYKSEFEPPYPRKPLDIHAAMMNREPQVEMGPPKKYVNPHKEEYRPPPLKDPEVICVEDPVPIKTETTYNTDYIAYQKSQRSKPTLKDVKLSKNSTKEAIMASHLECPHGPPGAYVCCLCLCSPPCKCPGKSTDSEEKRTDSNGPLYFNAQESYSDRPAYYENPQEWNSHRLPYYKTQESNLDKDRISAFCRGNHYHPKPVIEKY